MSINILDLRHDIVAEISKTSGPFQDTFLEKFILDGIKDLCKETYCYTEEISTVSVVDTATYTLTPVTANATLVGFISAMWGDGTDAEELCITNKRELDGMNRFWQQATGQPSAIIYNGDNTVRFNRIPDTAALTGVAIVFKVAIAPSNVDSVVPPVIEYRHLDAVKDYVKWRTYEHPDFLSIPLADRFEKKYLSRRRDLKGEILEDQMGNTTVKARSFLYD